MRSLPVAGNAFFGSVHFTKYPFEDPELYIVPQRTVLDRWPGAAAGVFSVAALLIAQKTGPVPSARERPSEVGF